MRSEWVYQKMLNRQPENAQSENTKCHARYRSKVTSTNPHTQLQKLVQVGDVVYSRKDLKDKTAITVGEGTAVSSDVASVSGVAGEVGVGSVPPQPAISMSVGSSSVSNMHFSFISSPPVGPYRLIERLMRDTTNTTAIRGIHTQTISFKMT